jgi:hypothetical protein
VEVGESIYSIIVDIARKNNLKVENVIENGILLVFNLINSLKNNNEINHGYNIYGLDINSQELGSMNAEDTRTLSNFNYISFLNPLEINNQSEKTNNITITKNTELCIKILMSSYNLSENLGFSKESIITLGILLCLLINKKPAGRLYLIDQDKVDASVEIDMSDCILNC